MSERYVPKKLKVHYRILTQPNFPAIDMLNNANDIYNDLNISVDLVSNIRLVNVAPEQMKHRIVRKDCTFGMQITNQESELYNYNRNYKDIKVVPREVVVYFISDMTPEGSMTPKGWGCTYRNFAKASVIIVKNAHSYVLAHELGHMLSLIEHSDDRTNLMHADNPFNGKPNLRQDQIETIVKSTYLWTK